MKDIVHLQKLQISEQIHLFLDILRNKYKLYPVFAAEIEFYLTNDSNDVLSFIEQRLGLKIQKEKGNKQYEVSTNMFADTFEFIQMVNLLKKKIHTIVQDEMTEVNFKPKPFPRDYGSAMHIHIHLNDDRNSNIFGIQEIMKNQCLLHMIGGILELLNPSLYMITGDDEGEFARFSSGYMAPSNISWGKNNRTTAIRIPETCLMRRNRRIEFRVPSAQACIEKVVLFLLTSTIYGLHKKVMPGDCIYGNAYDEIYNLKSLHKDSINAKNSFKFFEIISELLEDV